eukprot:2453316-Pleurochrysis_carterae.AAC.1
MSSSLESLLNALPDEKKKTLRLITNDPEKFKLICKKAPFPYDWLDSHEKLLEGHKLPSRKEWFNSMTQTKLSKPDYYAMIDTCNQLDICDFRDYHD